MSITSLRINICTLKFPIKKKLNFLQFDHKIQWFTMFNYKMKGKGLLGKQKQKREWL